MSDIQTIQKLMLFIAFSVSMALIGIVSALWQDVNEIKDQISMETTNLDTSETLSGSYLDRQNYVESPSGLIFAYCDYNAKYIQT